MKNFIIINCSFRPKNNDYFILRDYRINVDMIKQYYIGSYKYGSSAVIEQFFYISIGSIDDKETTLYFNSETESNEALKLLDYHCLKNINE
jgi:hypothetical protein